MAEGKKYLIGPRNLTEILSQQRRIEDQRSTIYIHVPFCTKICSFCNMRRSLQEPKENYATLIVEEIKQYAKLPYIKGTTFDAVYFGGGTPTTLAASELRLILRTLKEQFSFTKNAEFTIETTITQLTKEKREVLVEEGINRFSLGVQTFDHEGRKLMGRIGSGEDAFRCLKELKSNQDLTISMDLIYHYPNQTMESLSRDLDQMLELEMDGFSMYSLINMKETMIEDVSEDELEERMFDAITNHMGNAGYQFLELTKMVKKDRYQYIMNRHQGADTLPLGAGAGGSLQGLAIMNPISLAEYENSVQAFEKRTGMYFKEEYKEVVRFKGDIQTAFLPKNEKLYKDIIQYNQFLTRLLDEEMVTKQGDYYRLTNKGIFWGNTISRELSQMIV